MKDNELITRKNIELALLNKGQNSRRYRLGDIWELNYDEIREVLDDVDADVQPVVRWIPWDSGSFPDDSGTYIVTAYDGVKERVTFAKFQKRLKRWELTGARAYWRVLAWMPLPPSYKGEDNEVN